MLGKAAKVLVSLAAGSGRNERAMSSTTIQSEPTRCVSGRDVPPEVHLIISAMEAAGSNHWKERRGPTRWPFRTLARLYLFSDEPGTSPWTIYTRDANARGLGFVTTLPLPLSHGGWVELIDSTGEHRSIHCTLSRCREAVKGWFEGALLFNREQHWCDPQAPDTAPPATLGPFTRSHLLPVIEKERTLSHPPGRPMTGRPVMRLVTEE